MDRYRYLPQKPTTLNPDGLPIGFTKGNARYGSETFKNDPNLLDALLEYLKTL